MRPAHEACGNDNRASPHLVGGESAVGHTYCEAEVVPTACSPPIFLVRSFPAKGRWWRLSLATASLAAFELALTAKIKQRLHPARSFRTFSRVPTDHA
jgi:hypothetical protein